MMMTSNKVDVERNILGAGYKNQQCGLTKLPSAELPQNPQIADVRKESLRQASAEIYLR